MLINPPLPLTRGRWRRLTYKDYKSKLKKHQGNKGLTENTSSTKLLKSPEERQANLDQMKAKRLELEAHEKAAAAASKKAQQRTSEGEDLPIAAPALQGVMTSKGSKRRGGGKKKQEKKRQFEKRKTRK